MGSGQSARKLTISNEDDVGVIKVSNAVVQRLQGADDGTGQGSKDVRGAWPSHPGPPSSGASYPPMQGAAQPSGTQVYHYPEYTISALEIQQQKERELSSQDEYWQRRLRRMEKNHEAIDRIIESEYKRAVEEMSDGEGSKEPIPKGTKPPCIDNSNKVLKCYQDNPREILKCSSLVEQFANCVDQRRAQVIAARC